MQDPIYVNQKRAAALLRLSVRSFQAWGVEPDERTKNECLYDVRRLLDEARRREQKPETRNLTEERARLAARQAERYELEIAQTEGNLIPAEAMVDAWSTVLVTFRQRMTRLRSDLSRMILSDDSPSSVVGHVRTEIQVALSELAEFDPVGDSAPSKANGRKRS